MIAFCEVPIGEGGVLGCVRCKSRSESTMRSADAIADDIEHVAALWPAPSSPNVTFAGAEPFRHPLLPQLIDVAVQRGFQRIRLRTDAGALAQPANASGVVSSGVRQLEVVLLGGPEHHDALSGRPGLFALAESGVDGFLRAGEKSGCAVCVTVLVPACHHNARVLSEAIGAAARLSAIAAVIDLSNLKRTVENESLVAAALQTATINRIAGCTVGWEGPVGALYERAPWDICEATP